MSYIPIIYTIKKNTDFISVLTRFVETWYEFEVIAPRNTIDYGNRLQIEISQNINASLNFLESLNNVLISGNKNFAYTGFNYIFRRQSLNIGYNKEINFLFLLQEGQQDFYYGIHKNELLNDNPKIYRFIRDNKTKEISYFQDNNLLEFLVSHICTRASKIKTKEYLHLIKKTDSKTDNKIKEFKKIFKHETKFADFLILEQENLIATIGHKEDDEYIDISINKWNEKQNDITEKIVELFEWKGWSDNNLRYKL